MTPIFSDLSFRVIESGTEIPRDGSVGRYSKVVATYPFTLAGHRKAVETAAGCKSGQRNQVAPVSRGLIEVIKDGRSVTVGDEDRYWLTGHEFEKDFSIYTNKRDMLVELGRSVHAHAAR